MRNLRYQGEKGGIKMKEKNDKDEDGDYGQEYGDDDDCDV